MSQVWEGLNVVKTGRVMLGVTDPKDSAPGTIRGDLSIQVSRYVLCYEVFELLSVKWYPKSKNLFFK